MYTLKQVHDRVEKMIAARNRIIKSSGIVYSEEAKRKAQIEKEVLAEVYGMLIHTPKG